MVDVFISHSSEDSPLAEQLVYLFRSSLNLHAQQIRCTSVDGYRLSAGADIDEQLREEVLASRVFISILSPYSLDSIYVLFELGARWGTKLPLFPILAPGMESRSLHGPLTGLNALNCESAGQLHQLVSDVGETLDAKAERPAVYQSNIEAILYSGYSQGDRGASPQLKRSPSDVGTLKVDPSGELSTLENEYSEAEQVIRRHCESEWPNDYSMRSYCAKQQHQALAILKQGRPHDIPEEVFAGIRSKCAADWPENYSMRQYCEKQQFDSYHELESEPG